MRSGNAEHYILGGCFPRSEVCGGVWRSQACNGGGEGSSPWVILCSEIARVDVLGEFAEQSVVNRRSAGPKDGV